jgi:hypothetical protein
VSANLGLKARVEGTAAPDPANLGLGEEGRSFYQREHVHFGDAYKHKTEPEERARRMNVKVPKDAKVNFTTSYSVWGKKVDLGEGNRPGTSAPKIEFVPPTYGLGEDGESMYKAIFHDPNTAPDYLATTRITKSAAEGKSTVVMVEQKDLILLFQSTARIFVLFIRTFCVPLMVSLQLLQEPYGPLAKSSAHENFQVGT